MPQKPRSNLDPNGDDATEVRPKRVVGIVGIGTDQYLAHVNRAVNRRGNRQNYRGAAVVPVIRFGKQHAKNGVLTFTQHKGRNRKPHKLVLPILPVLQAIIDASPYGDLTFLVTEQGRPFTDAGFGNGFRDCCVEAGVPGRAHGLRKAGATIAANNGATAHQLMAIFGWDTLRMAEQYTRAADQVRLAESAMHMLARENS